MYAKQKVCALVAFSLDLYGKNSDQVSASQQFGPSGEGGGGRVGRFIRDPFPLFCSGGYRQQFRHGQVCSIFQVVRSAFPLPTKASPILQSVLKDGFGEAVVTLDMLEPCEFPSLDSCMGARGCLESGFPETEKNGRIPICKIRTRYCEK